MYKRWTLERLLSLTLTCVSSIAELTVSYHRSSRHRKINENEHCKECHNCRKCLAMLMPLVPTIICCGAHIVRLSMRTDGWTDRQN